jgi:hypothetical protein
VDCSIVKLAIVARLYTSLCVSQIVERDESNTTLYCKAENAVSRTKFRAEFRDL